MSYVLKLSRKREFTLNMTKIISEESCLHEIFVLDWLI